MQDFDVLCVGDAKVDIILSINEAHINCEENNLENCELCVPYGGKIPVEQSSLVIGGNACNVSVGLSRLGLKAALCAEMGDDELASKIIKTLIHENVSEGFLKVTKNAASSFSVALNFKAERTLFVQHVRREHDFSLENANTKWVYLTSMGEKWEKAYDKSLKLVEEKDTKLAFNPGSLQLRNKYYNIERIIQRADVVFLNREEATQLLGLKGVELKGSDMENLITRIKEFIPKNLVVTDGINGSFSVDENGTVFKEGVASANAIERTGAGDAYATGYLFGYISGKDIQTSMRYGAINAASVVGKIGSLAGLLTREELEKKN